MANVEPEPIDYFCAALMAKLFGLHWFASADRYAKAADLAAKARNYLAARLHQQCAVRNLRWALEEKARLRRLLDSAKAVTRA
jgi:hypothetical protein